MTTQTIKTESRVYRVYLDNSGIYFAGYQPINPKTGLVWQSCRHITKGHNVFVCSNWRTNETTGVQDGKAPEKWHEKYQSMVTGFKTEEDAMNAIDQERKKSGK